MEDQLAIMASHREWEWCMPGSWHPMPSVKGVAHSQSGIPVSPPDPGFWFSPSLSLL